MRLYFLLLMSLVLLGIAFKEEVSAHPAPDPNPRHHFSKLYSRGRSYYNRGGYYGYYPSRILSYGKRSAEPEPMAGPRHRFGMRYRGKGYGGYDYYGYGK